MKKTIIIIGVFLTSFLLNSCQQFMYTPNYYVSVFNNNDYMYLTSFYYRSYNYGDDRWSKDMIYYDLDPMETYDLILDQGTYDFKIILEDEEYSYTIYEDGVYVNGDMVLDICYDCLIDSKKSKVQKVKKESLIYE